MPSNNNISYNILFEENSKTTFWIITRALFI